MPLMGKKKFNVINQAKKRVDAADKVTGRAKYAGDVVFQDMLIAGCLHGHRAHAKVAKIDTSKAKALDGVHAVLTAADILKPQSWADYYYITDHVKYIGDVVAIVAAETKEILEDALKAIEVEYEDMPGVFTVDEALQADAPQIREKGVGLVDGIPTKGTKGNIFFESYYALRKGNIAEGFAQCDVVIEKEYRTQFVEHAYIEPEAVIAISDPFDGLMTVHASSQNPYFTRRYVADALGITMNKARIVQRTLGGSFGGKEELVGLIAGRAAILAKATGRPVRLVVSREESMIESPKRHPFKFNYKIGATKAGQILALEGILVDNSGAYNNQTQFLNCRAMIHSAGPYNIPNIKTDTYGVFTNNVHSGAFRGYSSPQVIFAGEQLIEELAEALNMDIVELKRKNILRYGDLTATSQRLSQETIFADMMEDVIAKTDYQAKFAANAVQTGEIRKGVGLVTCYRGAGLGAETADAGGSLVTALEDGSFIINSGITENGQGLKTAYTQIAAEAMGIKFEDINLMGIDTHSVADSGMTVASRGTVMAAQSMKKAGASMKKLLLETARMLLSATSLEEVDMIDSVAFVIGQPERSISVAAINNCRLWTGKQLSVYEWNEPKELLMNHHTGQGNAFPTYAYGVCVAEVEVDTATGYVDVKKVTSAHDLGTVINPDTVKGQIYGGIAMGMGFATTEEIEVSQGKVGNHNFDSYIFPTSMDMPEMDAILYECEDPEGTYGAKSVGEPATEAVGAAIALAIANATGKRIKRLPADLERVLLGKSLRAGGDA